MSSEHDGVLIRRETIVEVESILVRGFPLGNKANGSCVFAEEGGVPVSAMLSLKGSIVAVSHAAVRPF